MSASCESCDASLPDGVRACPSCGTPVAGPGDTAVAPLPLEETGHVPVHVVRVEPHWFGIAPAAGLLGLAALALLASILLFVAGHWPLGLILVGFTLLLLAAFGEAAKRKPESELARRSLDTLRAVRARASVAVGSAALRTRAQRELTRARHELMSLQQLRGTKVAELGEAALADEADAVERLKREIGELDALAAETEAELHEIAERTDEHIRHARMSVQQTMIEPPGEPGDPGDPETGPAEPPPGYPPPDEGNPPEPARIPEPYPPPEITTPESSR